MVVKNRQNGKVINFIKGADLAIVPRLVDGQSAEVQAAIATQDGYANGGLRTLMFAKRELPSDTS